MYSPRGCVWSRHSWRFVRPSRSQSTAASLALSRISLLHRLYVRAKAGPAYAAAPDAIGPARLQNVLSLVLTPRQSLYFAAENSVGIALPAAGDKPPAVQKPRALALDVNGRVHLVDGAALRLFAGGDAVMLQRPRPDGPPEPPTHSHCEPPRAVRPPVRHSGQRMSRRDPVGARNVTSRRDAAARAIRSHHHPMKEPQ